MRIVLGGKRQLGYFQEKREGKSMIPHTDPQTFGPSDLRRPKKHDIVHSKVNTKVSFS